MFNSLKTIFELAASSSFGISLIELSFLKKAHTQRRRSTAELRAHKLQGHLKKAKEVLATCTNFLSSSHWII